jgi:hypothetical protein
VQEFAISLGWAPWSDLFRVDILNTIGISLMLMAILSWAVLKCAQPGLVEKDVENWSDGRPRPSGESARYLVSAAALVTAVVSVLTPLLWTTWRPRFLPWQLETYINGVHNLGQPQAWLFPIFPWTAFAFAGLAFGFLLVSKSSQKLGAHFFALAGVAGLGFIALSKFLDSRSFQLYPVYDYWHTSPNFFLIRVGMLLVLVLLAYTWCRWGTGQWGFSPMIQLGWTSLLVYWVHIEFVYGRFTILPRRSEGVAGASLGLLTISLAMLALSLLRTNLKPGTFSWPLARLTGRSAQLSNAPRAR